MAQQPIHITHISQLAEDHRLDLYCKGCKRHVKVDIPEISGQAGRYGD